MGLESVPVMVMVRVPESAMASETARVPEPVLASVPVPVPVQKSAPEWGRVLRKEHELALEWASALEPKSA